MAKHIRKDPGDRTLAGVLEAQERRLGEIIGLLGEVRRELGTWPARGTREPKGRHLQQLARLFKVSADDVLLVDPEEVAVKRAA